MDRKKKEFLARLRETFRVEASEHLEGISAGLLAIEGAAIEQRAPLVERIFREAHSLKGAARSVSLPGVEALCMELESVFAAMKREEQVLSAAELDTIHQALGVVATLCEIPGAQSSPGNAEGERNALAALRQITGKAAPVSPPTPTNSKQLEPEIVAPAVSRDTVRVSTQKLGAILLETEELIGAKITAAGRAGELRALAADLARWNQRRVRETARHRRTREDASAAAEILDSELLYTRTLENSLRTLAGSAQQDALSLAAIADRLLEDAKKMLLLPCSYLLGTLPKILRDLAREQGKEADLQVSGEDIEIDRRVLDELKDPFIHLLRNSVDHGLESPDERRTLGKPPRGSVAITARAVEGNRVEITVTDDGAGIDGAMVRSTALKLGLIDKEEDARLEGADVTRLVFHSGLSTNPIITDLSGRGLGLAIVREKVERLGGTINVTSSPGVGTSFHMLLPLSLATFRGVFVGVKGKRFAIPTAGVLRVCRVEPDDIRTVENRRTFAQGERVVSLVRLEDILGLSGSTGRGDDIARPAVVVCASDRQVAFMVDDVFGEQEMTVKGLGPQLPRVRNVAGSTISGSGEVIPILNAVDLVESAITSGAPAPVGASTDATTTDRTGRLLIAEDSITARTLLKSILESAGYEVTAAVDGMDALTRLKTEAFDLLVSDVDMPRMNGFELTAKVRADRKLAELPVVLVTALGSQKDREYGIEVGANAYIVKSDFDQGNLLEIIRRLM